MRPTAVEVIRGIQGTLMGVVAPELHSMFAQDTGQTMQMLLESLANEWDTAAETLSSDNTRLRDLLSQAAAAIRSLRHRDDGLVALAEEIEAGLNVPPEESVAVSRLSARNAQLLALLERTLVACEDADGQPQFEALRPVRQSIYHHLRNVAGRGWSFWDVLSFRERMAGLRADTA